MTKRGCCLFWVMLAVGALFVWANATVELSQFGTVQHVGRDGTVKTNPTAILVMIAATAVGIVIVAAMLTRAEKKAQDDILLAPVAKAGCGTGLAMLAVLGVCGLLGTIAAMMGGA